MKKIVAVALAALLLAMSLPLQTLAVGLTPGDYETPIISLLDSGIKFAVTADSTTAQRGGTIAAAFEIRESCGFTSLEVKPDLPEGIALQGTPVEGTVGAFTFNAETGVITFAPEQTNKKTGTLFTATLSVAAEAVVGENAIGLTVLSALNGEGQAIAEKDLTVTPVTVNVVALMATGISLAPEAVTVYTAEGNNTAEITAALTPAGATETGIVWTSSDEEVATVSGSGTVVTVTGLKKGTATITAAAYEGGPEATCTVTVECSHTQWAEVAEEAFLKSEATCVAKAVYYKSCAACGEKSATETFETAVDPDNHVNTISFPAKVANCVYGGHTAYEFCCDCGKSIGYQSSEVDPANHENKETVGAKKATYMDEGYTGDLKCLDCNTVLEEGSVIPRLVAEETDPQILLTGPAATPKAGDKFTVTAELKNVEGVTNLVLAPRFPEAFTVDNVENKSALEFNEETFTFTGETAAQDGALVTITFKTADSLEEDDYLTGLVGFDIISAQNGENDVGLKLTPAEVEVQTFIWGDANGDKKVDTADIIRLKNYLAGVADVTVGAGADANGDKKVDAADITRLKNYLANFGFETGTPSVALGPQA